MPSPRKTIVGMVHLKPLPGSTGFGGSMQQVLDGACADAQSLEAGGVDAIMIENFGDIPFFKDNVPPQTVAGLTAAACAVRTVTTRPIGINCLRNDGLSALSIACASGAAFVRINVLCGARVADQGIIEGRAAEVARLRATLRAPIKLYADVDVKHSVPLAPRPIEQEVWDTLQRGLADALIVSGSGTGKPADLEQLRVVKWAAGSSPVFVGSGVDTTTILDLLKVADGVIVGTSLKRDGRVDQPVDAERVRRLVELAGS
jgi:membrane complex biogenesis BtpA family protein